MHDTEVNDGMEDFEGRLAELVSRYDQRLAAERQRLQQEEVVAHRFLRRFAELRKNVLHPVLEQTEAMLERVGHRCVISTQRHSSEAEAEVRLSVYPKGYDTEEFTNNTIPYIRFIAHPALELVSVDTGISLPRRKEAVGPRDTVPMETLTRSNVEEHVLTFLREIFDPRDPRQKARGEWSGRRGQSWPAGAS